MLIKHNKTHNYEEGFWCNCKIILFLLLKNPQVILTLIFRFSLIILKNYVIIICRKTSTAGHRPSHGAHIQCKKNLHASHKLNVKRNVMWRVWQACPRSSSGWRRWRWPGPSCRRWRPSAAPSCSSHSPTSSSSPRSTRRRPGSGQTTHILCFIFPVYRLVTNHISV